MRGVILSLRLVHRMGTDQRFEKKEIHIFGFGIGSHMKNRKYRQNIACLSKG